MKPAAFEYKDPRTVEDALALLDPEAGDVVVLAGGQSLLPLLNLRMAAPDRLLDINRVAGLDGVDIGDSSITIGALARLASIEADDDLAAALPILREAIALVAHPQIRNRSTIGGTLCHADPTAELPAVALALGARLHLRSRAGDRVEDAAAFFESAYQTSKRADELLVAVELPRHDAFAFTFMEVARRSHGDFPYVGLCFGVRIDGGVVAEARLAASGVAERPVRLSAAEAVLTGRRLGDDLIEVVDAAVAEVDPPGDIHGTSAYRKGLLRTLIRRSAARLDERNGR